MALSREVTITKLQKHNEGYWTCNITAGRQKAEAHNRFGSWMIDAGDGMLKDVLPEVAAKLQDKVRPIEKKERIAREKEEAAATNK